MTIVNASTGKVAYDARAEAVENRARRQSVGGDKFMYKEVRKSLENMKRTVKLQNEQMQRQKYYMSPQFDAMQKMLESINQTAERCCTMYTEGDYGPCDDEIWRCSVETESLASMLAAI